MTPAELVPRLREFCLAFPEVWEDTPWGHVVWKVGKKIFAIGDENSTRVTVKATLDEQSALILHPNIEVASHIGRHGWVTVDVVDQDMLDLLLELVEKSFEYVAPKRLLKARR